MTANPETLYAHRGAWLTPDGLIQLPYDLEHGCMANATPAPANAAPSATTAARMPGPARPLSEHAHVFNAANARFSLLLDRLKTVHIVNAMGVVLGDSIVGLTVLHALKRACPHLELVLYRPATTPDYVEQLYRLAAGLIGEIRYLPWPAERIPAGEPIVDIGNLVYWPRFATLPTLDFFCEAMGIDPSRIPAADRANRWLSALDLPALPAAWRSRPYVLFSPEASTPIRRIPPSIRHAWIDRLWNAYRLPVLGFADCRHPHFVDIRALAPDTPSFLAWIRHAKAMVSADSAAVHAAAGFDVPTTAIFTTIDPYLRVRDYPRCRHVKLRIEALHGIHSSSLEAHLALVEYVWRYTDMHTIPLPEADIGSLAG
ncbi:MAG: ADP-heptose--LPS heptosyltransferase [Pararobbsia sp.]